MKYFLLSFVEKGEITNVVVKTKNLAEAKNLSVAYLVGRCATLVKLSELDKLPFVKTKKKE